MPPSSLRHFHKNNLALIEVWKDIPGYEGAYAVSNLGRVKSLHRATPDKRWGYRIIQERILSPSISRLGYHYVYLRKDKKTKPLSVHSLVLLAFKGPRPHPKMQGRHLNGEPRHNELTNLKWGTARQNQRDRIKHGTDDNGEKSANAKLTWKQVAYIRSLPKKTRTQLAKDLGVSQTVIYEVQTYKTWRRPNG